MLMQDSLTGYVHEVPNFGEAEPIGEMVYDGFGNPVGYFGARRRRSFPAPEPSPQSIPPAPMPPEAGMRPEPGPEGGQGMPSGEAMGEVAYDRFGNPVGEFPSFLNPFRAIGRAVRGVGSLVASPFRLFQPGGRGGLPFPFPGLRFPGLSLPALASGLAAQRRLIEWYRTRGRPAPPAIIQNFQRLLAQYQRLRSRRWLWPGARPPGWIHPSLPYTGMGPRRVYMRCATWLGPRGLVPAYAAQMPATAGQPAAYRHHRRRHRR
jgi:hypothetical protein